MLSRCVIASTASAFACLFQLYKSLLWQSRRNILVSPGLLNEKTTALILPGNDCFGPHHSCCHKTLIRLRLANYCLCSNGFYSCPSRTPSRSAFYPLFPIVMWRGNCRVCRSRPGSVPYFPSFARFHSEVLALTAH